MFTQYQEEQYANVMKHFNQFQTIFKLNIELFSFKFFWSSLRIVFCLKFKINRQTTPSITYTPVISYNDIGMFFNFLFELTQIYLVFTYRQVKYIVQWLNIFNFNFLVENIKIRQINDIFQQENKLTLIIQVST